MAIWTPEYIDTTHSGWTHRIAAASRSNGSNISQWADKSGNGNHASQATAGAQPALTAAGLGGLDVATFDGVDDYLSLAAGITLQHDGGYRLWSDHCWYLLSADG